MIKKMITLGLTSFLIFFPFMRNVSMNNVNTFDIDNNSLTKVLKINDEVIVLHDSYVTKIDYSIYDKSILNNKKVIKDSVFDELLIDKLSLENFKTVMWLLESRGHGDYKAVNSGGYIGKYQFSIYTLRLLKKNNYLDTLLSTKDYLLDSAYQEISMNMLVAANLQYILNNNMDKYVDTEINNIKITLEGMLASSHLLGVESLKHYLNNNGSMENFKMNNKTIRKYDGNGTSLEEYLKIFSEL